MSDHAREAAEKIIPQHVTGDGDALERLRVVEQQTAWAASVIQSAIDAACEERDALKRLESWKHAHKRRSVRIDIDNGYGATCWEVRLDGENAGFVEAFEHCGNQTDNRVSVMQDGEDWPGLNATIMAAIVRWEKLYGPDNETNGGPNG